MRSTIVINSLFNRRGTVLLTLLSLIISIVLVLGINHIRSEVKNGFKNTLSATDLIVGARGSALNLLLYSVFHMGNPTHNIRWDTYEELAKHSQVDWLIPLAMGDSHKGYRVVATSEHFFKYYAYGDHFPLTFNEGAPFASSSQVVLGAAVARDLHYKPGDKIILSHGVAEVSLAKHDDSPFVVSGILASTGTPVDKALYISLAGMELIHRDWKSGVRISGSHSHEEHKDSDQHEIYRNNEGSDEHPHFEDGHPQTLSAILVGLKNRSATFTVQRQINQYSAEPLQAIIPGLVLAELWQLLASAETAFNLIAWLVVLASLLGMITCLLTALNERQREFAILRSLGAGYFYIFSLVMIEVFILCLFSIAIAVVSLTAILALFQSWILSEWGIQLSLNILNESQLEYLAIVLIVALAMCVIPALTACKRSLNDGLLVKN